MNNNDVKETIRALEVTDPIHAPKRFTWDFRRKDLRNRIIQANGDLSGMYDWPVAKEALVTGATTHAEGLPLSSEFKRLALNMCTNDAAIGSYLRQMYVFQLLVDHGMFRADASIYEFGGGLGLLPIVLDAFVYRGRYTACDFPEMLLIQRWHHENRGIKNVSYENCAGERPKRHDLFVSVCALDETPTSTREVVMDKANAQNHLIWFTDNYLGADGLGPPSNKKWFVDYYAKSGHAIHEIAVPPTQLILLATKHEI